MDHSSAGGTPLTYHEMVFASEQNDMGPDFHADHLLREYEQHQAEFDSYCQDLWNWLQNELRVLAPCC
ncbi:unnamed protein product [Ectocarpus sp. CCAP 1310/34]|nr:unnamed protein product [Ectocarpus sp. CCAP 1310/34]